MARQRPASSPVAQDSTARDGPSAAATGTALLATFYADQEAKVVDRLQDVLCGGLGLERDRPGRWRTPGSNEAFLRRFDPPNHPDATVLQVTLASPGDAAQAWGASRRRLEGIVRPEALDGIWGYTLAYLARLNPGFAPEEAYGKLRSAARLLHPGKEPYAALARSRVAGGDAWLLAAPTEEGGGVAAGTVYVALSEPEEGSELRNERDLGNAFLGRGAELLMPELIAHKSYFQIRQYRGRRHEQYKGHLKAFRELVRELLKKLGQQEEVLRDDEVVRKLTRRYNKLAEMVWVLEDLRVSMARQLHNYDEWEVTRDNGILRYHRRHIETANTELELLVGEGRYALGVADPVLSLSRYHAEKAREERRQRERDKEERAEKDREERQQRRRDKEERRQRSTTLAVTMAGIAIGVPGVLNQQATAALLVRFPPAAWLLDRLFGVRELNLDNDAHTLIVLAAQLVIVAAVAGLFYLVISRLFGELGEGSSGRE